MTQTDVELLPIDASDVDRWIGRPVGGGQLKDPIRTIDIRRWAQGMQNPNPLYYDEDYAADSVFGRIVAPQSFTICCDVGHGATPSIQGTIPGSHMLFGGDEWWFHGPRIYPGDKVRVERMAYDYRVTDTSFAGPTMFQRGDTTYINQHGEVVARQRSTSIRYLAENARRLGAFADAEEPRWTEDDVARFEQEKYDYYQTFQSHPQRTAAGVSEGEELPRGILGPHTVASFTTEWRSYLFTLWGSHEPDGLPSSTMEAGWLPEMTADQAAAALNPAWADGLNYGASRGHVNERWAKLIGMPRGYGYGASMGAWVIDYVSNWAGEAGFVTHSAIQYRNPAFTGDVTYLTGTIASVGDDPTSADALVTVDVVMTTQDGTVMAKGPVEVRLPKEAK
jgi:acyl dehydratase